jgi:hypothetical protein
MIKLQCKTNVLRLCIYVLCLFLQLTHLLTYDEINRYVGKQYQILVSKHETILMAENFCIVKIFYKQRVFEYLLQQNDNFTSSTTRQNYLIALVHSLKQIPEELLFLHLIKVLYNLSFVSNKKYFL